MVQGEDAALAWRRFQFNSGWVHLRETACSVGTAKSTSHFGISVIA